MESKGLPELLNLAFESTPGVPMGETHVYTFRLRGAMPAPKPKTMRVEIAAGGTRITAEYETTEALMQVLVTLLEDNGYTITKA